MREGALRHVTAAPRTEIRHALAGRAPPRDRRHDVQQQQGQQGQPADEASVWVSAVQEHCPRVSRGCRGCRRSGRDSPASCQPQVPAGHVAKCHRAWSRNQNPFGVPTKKVANVPVDRSATTDLRSLPCRHFPHQHACIPLRLTPARRCRGSLSAPTPSPPRLPPRRLLPLGRGGCPCANRFSTTQRPRPRPGGPAQTSTHQPNRQRAKGLSGGYREHVCVPTG